MKKRFFEVLDEMNQDDTKNETRLVSVSYNFVEGNKVKQGAKITMGTEYSGLMDIMNDKVIPVLLLVDKDEYFKRAEGKKEKASTP